jgi:Uma2 family endonuclease
MKHLTHPLTADDLFRMSHDGVRRELVRGEAREMAPAGGEHGWTSGNIYGHLYTYNRKKKLGFLFAAETGFVIERNPDTVRAPDCAFVRVDRLTRPLPKKYVPLAPDLAVETVSPADRAGEVREKVTMWLQSGVRLVWVLDPAKRTVTVHHSGCQPRMLREGDFLEGEDVVPGFRVAVRDLWV